MGAKEIPDNRSDAFTRLGEVTKQIEHTKIRLSNLMALEVELYKFLQLTQPGIEGKPKRKRITEEKAVDIRRMISSVMKSLTEVGFASVAMQLIVQRVNQEMPNAEVKEIEGQLRVLAASSSSSISHNGQHGRASAYCYNRETPLQEQERDQTGTSLG